MTDQERVAVSKYLGYVLRNKPYSIGIKLDVNGWTDIATLIESINRHISINVTFNDLKDIVYNNSRQRFAFNDANTKIRSNHGHICPVRKGYCEIQPPSILYHGVPIDLKLEVLSKGLMPLKRQSIRLADDYKVAIKDKKYFKSDLFVVDTAKMYEDGHTFYSTTKDIWQTLFVPAKYISKVKFEAKPNYPQLTYYSFGTPLGILEKSNIGYIYTSYTGNEHYYREYKRPAHFSYELWNSDKKGLLLLPYDIYEFLNNCKREDIVAKAKIEPNDSEWERMVKLSKLNVMEGRFYVKPTGNVEQERIFYLKPRR